MSSELFFLIICFFIFLIIFLLVVLYFGHRYFKLKELQEKNRNIFENNSIIKKQNFHEEQKSSDVKLAKTTGRPLNLERAAGFVASSTQSGYCSDHPDQLTAGTCAISGQSFCSNCLVKFDTFFISKKYQDIYLSNNWVEISTFPDRKDDNQIQKSIFELKKKLWEDQEIPLIIQGQYKINIETDDIESFFVLLGRDVDITIIKNKMTFLN